MTFPGRYSGMPIQRVEDDRLLRGGGQYTDDIDLPGQLAAAIVRSVHANARIVSIDTAAAGAARGVHMVITGDDLGALGDPLPLLGPSPALIAPRTQRPLATERVHYVGEAVAMVVADSRYLAEDAAALVEVQYEPLDAVVSLATADRVAARVHDEVEGNLAGVLEDRIGDPEAAFRSAPHVERLHLELERSTASPIEGRAVLADWDRHRRHLRVWDSTQAPVAIKHGLCKMLGLSQEQVDVVAPDVGGGFGTKIMLFYPEEVLIPYAALRLARPVKWTEDRWEHFVSANQERGQIHDAEVAFDGDGRLLAVRTSFVHDTGAYIPYGIAVPANTATHVLGQYRIKNYDVKGRILYTNKTPVSPYRGAGRPHAVFVMERLICAVARRLGLEPHEVRRRNLIQSDEFPYETGLHLDAPVRYDSGDYVKGLEEAIRLLDPAGFRREQAAARAEGRHLGMGMGTYVEATGPAPYESCRARVTEAGHAVFDIAVPSQGQGHQTSMAQIAADVLDLPIEQVLIRGGDSSRVEDGIGTFGSRALLLAGNAVAVAARDLRRQLTEYAAALFECAAADIVVRDGWFQVAGAPDKRVSLSALAALANAYGYPGQRTRDDDPRLLEQLQARAEANRSTPPIFEARGYFGAGQQLYGSGVHAATVEVEATTGHVRILKYVVVHDCGRMINPAIVEGQVLGGLVQGIGGALLEKLEYDDSGQPRSTSFMDFRLPTMDDVPEIVIAHVETPSPLNPLGVKGTGEAGIIPASALLAEAVEDALKPFGVIVDRMPMLPHDVAGLVRAVREAQDAEAAGTAKAPL
jgi:carbon-monoxide dehydrogenase large subunit